MRGLQLSCALVAASIWLIVPQVNAVVEGEPAPAFAAKKLVGDGNLSLSKYKGKVVYLDFWASWCGPCTRSLPMIDELRKEFPASKFQVLAINLDRDLDKARAMLAKHGISYPSVSDPKGKLPETFGLKTMPTSYLIDRKGVVRLVHKGFRPKDIESLRTEIKKLVGEKR